MIPSQGIDGGPTPLTRSKKKVLSWSIFTTTLELTLSKIREKNNCPAPPAGGAGQEHKLVSSGAKNSFGVWGKRKFFAPSSSQKIFAVLKVIFCLYNIVVQQGKSYPHVAFTFAFLNMV